MHSAVGEVPTADDRPGSGSEADSDASESFCTARSGSDDDEDVATMPQDLQSVLHMDLLLELASHMSLTALTLLQRAAGRDLLPRIKQICSVRHNVTAADVEEDVHVPVLRHLLSSSTCQVITLPPAVFMLGSVTDPQHVERVRPAKPAFDERSQNCVVEWLNYIPRWKRGFGPLQLLRSVTLRGETARGTIGERSHERARLYFLDAPCLAGAVIEIDTGPLRITMQGLDIYPCSEPLSCFYVGDHFHTGYNAALGLSTGGCPRCQTPASRQHATCTCVPFGGPSLEMSDCFVNGGLDLRGRSVFERCTFMQPENLDGTNKFPTPWHRMTMFEQMNNIRCDSFGDRTVTREPNGKCSIVCSVAMLTSNEPDSQEVEMVHEVIQNSWEAPANDISIMERIWPQGMPRRRLDQRELRSPAAQHPSAEDGQVA